MIPFNKPYLSGKETQYIADAVNTGKISGNGEFTQKCHRFFQEQYDLKKCLLTTSCTDALEMAAILMDIKPGDEVIVPSFTFVSTANAFVLRGARIVFADSSFSEPNMDVGTLKSLITPKTKAIVVVHYAGVACDMDPIMALAEENDLYVIEDAAQAIDSYYKGKPLGSIGHFGAFSFHETKNIISGEGGLLIVNDERFADRAEIIWEKGTNRSAFFRGEVDKYGWVDVGSSFLPSEIIAAFLFAQLENLEKIQNARRKIWDNYYGSFLAWSANFGVGLPIVPDYASNNSHMFYLVCTEMEERDNLITSLRKNKILSVFHYLPLHQSVFYKDKHDGRLLPNSIKFSERIVRLPLYYGLTQKDQSEIIRAVFEFYKKINDTK